MCIGKVLYFRVKPNIFRYNCGPNKFYKNWAKPDLSAKTRLNMFGLGVHVQEEKGTHT